MSSLYELVMDFKELSEIDFTEDLEQEKVEEIKDIIKAEIETKGTNIIALIKNIVQRMSYINQHSSHLWEKKCRHTLKYCRFGSRPLQ